MTDGERLLRGVLENPADDNARLVYADWLEENGEAERAEFIRLQVRIGEIQRTCRCGVCVRLRGGGQNHNGPCGINRERIENPDGTSRQAFLRMREQEIMGTDIFLSWCGRTVAENVNESRYRRGFISHIGCTPAAWLEHGPRIVAAHPVERVEVSDQSPYPGRLRSTASRHAWFHPDVPSGLEEDIQRLPEFVFETIEGYRNQGLDPARVKWFDSFTKANAALSLTLVNWARREAGLPPLLEDKTR